MRSRFAKRSSRSARTSEVPVTRDEVHVERTTVNRDLRPGEEAFTEGNIRVPICPRSRSSSRSDRASSARSLSRKIRRPSRRTSRTPSGARRSTSIATRPPIARSMTGGTHLRLVFGQLALPHGLAKPLRPIGWRDLGRRRAGLPLRLRVFQQSSLPGSIFYGSRAKPQA